MRASLCSWPVKKAVDVIDGYREADVMNSNYELAHPDLEYQYLLR